MFILHIKYAIIIKQDQTNISLYTVLYKLGILNQQKKQKKHLFEPKICVRFLWVGVARFCIPLADWLMFHQPEKSGSPSSPFDVIIVRKIVDTPWGMLQTCLSVFFTCSSNFHHAFMDVYAEMFHLNHSETQPFSRLHTIAETAGGMGSAAPDVRAVDLWSSWSLPHSLRRTRERIWIKSWSHLSDAIQI